MAQHKKNPTFIKIITTDKEIACINPAQVTCFQVLYGTKIVDKLPDGKTETRTADVIRFFFPFGNGITYELGRHLTRESFDYILAALNEWVYLIRPEFDAAAKDRAEADMAAFQALMAEEEAESKAMQQGPETTAS